MRGINNMQEKLESLPEELRSLIDQKFGMHIEVPFDTEDPLYVKPEDVYQAISLGGEVDIEVNRGNYKWKHFRRYDNKNNRFCEDVIRKKCRISGTCESHAFGLGIYVSPENHRKSPFSLYIGDYGITWAIFKDHKSSLGDNHFNVNFVDAPYLLKEEDS